MSTPTIEQATQSLEQALVAQFDQLDEANPPADLTELEQVASAIQVVRALPTTASPAPTNPGATHATTRRPSIAQLSKGNRNQRQASPQQRSRVSLTAAITINGNPDGSSTNDLADALYSTVHSTSLRNAPLDVPQMVASLRWDYPPERQLTTDDPALTTAAMDQALTPGQPRSLIAYGGICEPVAVDYTIPTFTHAARPVRDGLPAFQATRGGVRFTPPPKLTQAGGAVTVWTAAMDAAGTGTKNCLTLACGTPQEQIVAAIATCVTMGNMTQRFSPELVNAWLDNTAAATARTAELALLQAIDTGSLKLTSTGHGLGAARDLLPVLDQAAAGLRYRNRVDRNSPAIRVIAPDWLKDLLRADIAKELAHDNDTSATDALALADSRLADWFSERNINPIWALDDLTAPPFNSQAAGALAGFPASTTFYMFHEGSWVFLDGGRLDVGYIRDSQLNATNNVQMFTETFEAVAFRGLESIAITMPLTATGASSSGVVPT